MLYSISSGNGPSECELAVYKFTQYLVDNYNTKIIESSSGYNDETYRSVIISSNVSLSEFIGSILWRCKSIYRPHHKRKNWFIDFKYVGDINTIKFDKNLVKITTMRSSGKGGQNVNKVETGVRAVYIPTGDTVVCMDQRSQYVNKCRALELLENIVYTNNKSQEDSHFNELRVSHTNLTRGNTVAKFEGVDFRRIQ